MSGISIISNFDVNQSVPIDSRLVASSSIERDAILYKYAGLKVYLLDERRTYTYNGTTWEREGSGIYGGSGSIPGDVMVDFGTVSTTIGDESYDLVYRTNLFGTTKAYLTNNFVRHTAPPLSVADWGYVEFRHQYKYLDANNILRQSSYIAFNPRPSGSDTGRGGLAFWTGISTDNSLKEKLRITNSGKVGIGVTDPKEFLQIATISNSTSSPLVLHNGGSAVIGHNWFYTNNNQFFESTKPSITLNLSEGRFFVRNRLANTGASAFIDTIYTTGQFGGRVGVKNTSPTTTLDVGGEILGLTVSSNNKMQAKIYSFSTEVPFNLFNNTILGPGPNSIFTSFQNTFVTNPTLYLKVGGTNSISTDGNLINLAHNSNVSGDLNVNGDLTVDGSYGNFEVTNNGRITNNEQSTNLSIYFSSIGGQTYNPNAQTGGFNILFLPSFLSNQYFTASVSAYRVGALVNLDIECTTLSNFDFGYSNFYGIQFYLQDPSSRFIPSSSFYGSGMGYTMSYYPLAVEAFQIDPSGGGASNLNRDDVFIVRLRTLQTNNPTIGSEFVTGTSLKAGTKFFGSISYKAKNVVPPAPTPPPVPPTVVPTFLTGLGYVQ